MPSETVFLDPGNEHHVAIMGDDDRAVRVKLTCEVVDGDHRLVVNVDEQDTGRVAVRTPSTANWHPST
ncbi:hypothetical protein [Mycobacterium phage Weirdo19]|uniref:Uncharacterized protein n=1 Tax=Mycobacterium phage Weirdo19 TaxID=2601610 RepID=A0A6M2YSS7_9CAUD|nr:hypothetical protein KDJ11_gp57 [Mycobacterium phage Weirdo19]QEA10825.1 hypothetical protein [Mycobacterium phage Weirdo19]